MNKGLVIIILIFFSLVFLNFISGVMNNLLSNISLPSALTQNQSGFGGLTSIDFSLFAKNGSGRSYVTQGYGRTPYSYRYPDGRHDGIDIAASYNAPIYSPDDGVVLAVGNQDTFCYHRAFGKYIAIKDSAKNLVLWYAHLGSMDVTPGQTVLKNAKIGTVGATGLETGPHLHFSVFDANGFTMTPRNGCGPMPTGQDLNPLNYLSTIF